MIYDIPDEFFGPPTDRGENWPDYPDLRNAVSWLKTFISPEEWRRRRKVAASRLYEVLLGKLKDPTGKGKLFVEEDSFGWYLFLAEAYLDHSWDYEPIYGSR